MCGLSFFYYCSLKRISLFPFFFEVMVFDFVVRNNVFRFFVFLLAEKPNCGLYNVFVDVFICKLYTFSWWTKAVCHLVVIRLFFFCFFLSFYFQDVNCTFYGTQKTKFSWVCLKLKYLTELKVYFPDLKDQNEIVASDEHLCLCDGNVTCCFNSCTLFFYQTLGLSFYADHKCCRYPFLCQVP